MPDVLMRVFWAAGIVLLGLLAYRLANRLVLARAAGRRLGLETLQPGVPAILYFTTPGCAPCRTIQRPALKRLQERLGERLQVIEVDAWQRPDLADFWGVLSVPTTFLLDGQGRPRRVNHGVAGADKLFAQLQELQPRAALLADLRGLARRILQSGARRAS